MRLKPFLFVLFIGCFLSCSEDDSPVPDCTEVACTEEFVSFAVSVTDASGAWVPLDSFEVIERRSGTDITFDYTPEDLEGYREVNSYPLLSDVRAREYQNRRVGLRFRGFIGGNLVAEGDFTGGADCCHVVLFEGSLELIVD